ncbi:hypothetical protein DL95DRAFT_391450 [Leptodontidium sp. 2 PMI_412]|nr:hypothetical protein DL95DRAFT_391450 [Leptodontidium sp. 2 PMI_412]
MLRHSERHLNSHPSNPIHHNHPARPEERSSLSIPPSQCPQNASQHSNATICPSGLVCICIPISLDSTDTKSRYLPDPWNVLRERGAGYPHTCERHTKRLRRIEEKGMREVSNFLKPPPILQACYFRSTRLLIPIFSSLNVRLGILSIPSRRPWIRCDQDSRNNMNGNPDSNYTFDQSQEKLSAHTISLTPSQGFADEEQYFWIHEARASNQTIFHHVP